MTVSDSASPRSVLRSRRPQTRLETSCTRTGRPRRCLRRGSAAGRRVKAMAARPACTSLRSRTAEYYPTDKRQKNQYCLAFPEESRGAAPTAFEGGTESELAKRTAESPASEQWMEEVCERENLEKFFDRVNQNGKRAGESGRRRNTARWSSFAQRSSSCE